MTLCKSFLKLTSPRKTEIGICHDRHSKNYLIQNVSIAILKKTIASPFCILLEIKTAMKSCKYVIVQDLLRDGYKITLCM